jgi:hypothetical protein
VVRRVGLEALGSPDSVRRHRCRAFYQRQYPDHIATANAAVQIVSTRCTDEVLHRTTIVLRRIKMRRHAVHAATG